MIWPWRKPCNIPMDAYDLHGAWQKARAIVAVCKCAELGSDPSRSCGIWTRVHISRSSRWSSMQKHKFGSASQSGGQVCRGPTGSQNPTCVSTRAATLHHPSLASTFLTSLALPSCLRQHTRTCLSLRSTASFVLLFRVLIYHMCVSEQHSARTVEF